MSEVDDAGALKKHPMVAIKDLLAYFELRVRGDDGVSATTAVAEAKTFASSASSPVTLFERDTNAGPTTHVVLDPSAVRRVPKGLIEGVNDDMIIGHVKVDITTSPNALVGAQVRDMATLDVSDVSQVTIRAKDGAELHLTNTGGIVEVFNDYGVLIGQFKGPFQNWEMTWSRTYNRPEVKGHCAEADVTRDVTVEYLEAYTRPMSATQRTSSPFALGPAGAPLNTNGPGPTATER